MERGIQTEGRGLKTGGTAQFLVIREVKYIPHNPTLFELHKSSFLLLQRALPVGR